MIEGFNNDGLRILINPAEVASVYRGPTWCNVQMRDGTIHRFAREQAEKVYRALRGA